MRPDAAAENAHSKQREASWEEEELKPDVKEEMKKSKGGSAGRLGGHQGGFFLWVISTGRRRAQWVLRSKEGNRKAKIQSQEKTERNAVSGANKGKEGCDDWGRVATTQTSKQSSPGEG